jgi:replicative DNA helicase
VGSILKTIKSDTEEYIIGAIMLDPSAAMPKLSELTAEDFDVKYYRDIFGICQKFYLENKAINCVTVLDGLKISGNDEADYKVKIARAAEAVPIVGNINLYAQILTEHNKRLKAVQDAGRLIKAIDSDEEMSKCQDMAIRISETLLSTQTDRILSAREGFVKFLESQGSPKTYITTGLKRLDDGTYLGFGDYMIIGGRPSSGKTALSLQFMLHMSKTYKIVYFSLETSAEKIFDRLIANYTKTHLGCIKTGNIEDWSRIARHGDSFSKLKFDIVDASGWTVAQIRAKAAELRAQIIFIDYLSLIKSQGKSIYERVTQASIDLHVMAQQTKITIITLSQLNREGKNEPDMANLRESGQIEQDADVILLLYQEDKKEQGKRNLVVAKNKEGRTGEISLDFDRATQSFYVLDELLSKIRIDLD